MFRLVYIQVIADRTDLCTDFKPPRLEKIKFRHRLHSQCNSWCSFDSNAVRLNSARIARLLTTTVPGAKQWMNEQ
jgi:hypothetical protein